MKRLFLFIALLSITIASLNDASFVKAEITMSGSVSNAELLLHVPFNDSMQEVIQTTDYEIFSDATGDYIKVTDDYEFKAIVVVNKSKVRITADPVLPVTTNKEYVEATALIDSDNERVREVAGMIAGGEDKLLETTARIVEWVYKNMDYDTSFLGSEKRKASEILLNMKGVCSDYSTLTAALLRARGVPVKYVEGFLLEEGKTTPHAWLEVYDGVEWFPIDPTNGNVLTGANLVKIQEGKDPSEVKNTVRYTGINFNPPKGNPTQAVVLEQKQLSGFFTTSLVLDHEKVGIGSSNAANLMIKNLKDEYLAPSLRFSHNNKITSNPEDSFMIIVLKPFEAKVKTWPFVVSNELNDSFQYFLPIAVSGPGFVETAEVVVSPDAPVYSSTLVISSIQVEDKRIKLVLENKGNKNTLVQITLSSDNSTVKKNVNLAQNEEKTITMNASTGVNTLRIEWEGNTIIRRINVEEPGQEQVITGFMIREEHVLGAVIIIILVLLLLIGRELKAKKPKKKERRSYKKHLLRRQMEKSLRVLSKPEEHGIEELTGKSKVFKKH